MGSILLGMILLALLLVMFIYCRFKLIIAELMSVLQHTEQNCSLSFRQWRHLSNGWSGTIWCALTRNPIQGPTRHSPRLFVFLSPPDEILYQDRFVEVSPAIPHPALHLMRPSKQLWGCPMHISLHHKSICMWHRKASKLFCSCTLHSTLPPVSFPNHWFWQMLNYLLTVPHFIIFISYS
jgi:hypothetical protein